MNKYLSDDIVAISTPLGHSGIGVIRLSGPNVISIVKDIFIPFKKEKDISKVPSHTLHYGKISDGKRIIDEVMVAILKAPNTYTREDMVEIYAHGGPIPLQEILNLILNKGARLAERGEFTKRAFLNGRIDLLQAEGILDVIYARSSKSLDIAIRKLEGESSEILKEIKKEVERLRIYLEAVLDFPEDVSDLERKEWINSLKNLSEKVKNLIERAERGEWLKGGYRVVLVGRPNVGKSSLFNALMREERVIVTPIPGTTRDYIEGELILSGYLIRLFDTAGIREPKDEIEAIGIKKTQEIIKKANLILFLIDISEPLKREDEELFKEVYREDAKIILVLNKIDLEIKIKERELEEKFPNVPKIYISTLTRERLDLLEEIIVNHIKEEESLDVLFFNTYHLQELRKSYDLLTQSLDILEKPLWGMDVLAENLFEIEKIFGNILGEEVSIDIVDKIFENFCVGK
ncbi:MAG: tRNA uridine-5-carboxymethylaminomethyl(34) synthesis GTPase MnmE [Dictyoglomaceae bacterium]